MTISTIFIRTQVEADLFAVFDDGSGVGVDQHRRHSQDLERCENGAGSSRCAHRLWQVESVWVALAQYRCQSHRDGGEHRRLARRVRDARGEAPEDFHDCCRALRCSAAWRGTCKHRRLRRSSAYRRVVAA